jgi:hypothetical protein
MSASRIGLDEQIHRSLQLLEDLGNEVEKLRAQINELLPWAQRALRVVEANGIDDPMNRFRSGAQPMITLLAPNDDYLQEASGLLERIESGEFGEVAS